MRIFTILMSLIVVIGLVACDSEEPSAKSTLSDVPQLSEEPSAKSHEFTLSDVPQLLDLSGILPDSFEQIDAASEGLSNKDMGLGSEFSEVEVFLSEDPYQLIYTFAFVTKSKVEKAGSDAVFRDDEQVENMLMEGIRIGAEEEGIYDISYADIEITHPNIGNMAVWGTGVMKTSGIGVGLDILWFRRSDTYVFLYSTYSPNASIESLKPIAETLDAVLVSWES